MSVEFNDEIIDKNIDEEVIEEEIVKEDDKPVANAIDALLAVDLSEFKTPSKKAEIPRISKALGGPFVVEIRLLNNTTEENIDKKSNILDLDEDGNPKIDINSEKQIALTLVEAVYTLEGEQLFKKQSLRKKFNVQSNEDLVKKMLLPGERKKLYARYKELSGHISTSVKDIKN
ncbi:phage tail assembly chaperone [Peptostreptococcus equinus]|uniref:Uncharacterized protein n=1 Tax=Peptostreptococcus equinus TaxID=3003601 RepID=A0ABY7JRJ9_9FIRM|nr:hypothetical protein [Peptostreptococcus sp. CBA3647]WAW15755.1 hypothetical protein O0R46_04700 [Peptostreptococcus sp. CBA3647]